MCHYRFVYTPEQHYRLLNTPDEQARFLVKKISRGLVFVIFSNGFVFTPLPSGIRLERDPSAFAENVAFFYRIYILYYMMFILSNSFLYIFALVVEASYC